MNKYIMTRIFFSILLSMFFLLQGCGEDANPNNPAPQNENEIFIQSSAYNPSTKTIAVGTTITWRNQDNTTHTVTSGVPGNSDGRFDSGNIANGGTYSFTFSTAGVYTYYCKLHPNMSGTITVQ